MKVVVIPPKEKWDALAESVIEGLYENNIKLYSSDIGNGIKQSDVYTDDEIIEYSKDCDYIFVIWGKVRNQYPGPKYYLLDKIYKKSRVVFIDGSEWTATGHPLPNQVRDARLNPQLRRGMPWINESMFENSSWYFKRECYSEDSARGIIPLPFVSTKNHYSSDNYTSEEVIKEIDVFCSYGQMNDGLRLETYNFCKELSDMGYIVESGKGFDFETFKNKIAKSYISIDAWGGGETCQRFWLNTANKTCCFSQKYTIDFPNKFTDGENFVEYENIEEFKEKIIFYLKNKQKCIKIGNEGYEHTKKYHTSKKQVQYIFKKIGEKI
tara:strand:+ start:4207 stop:5178 length:972 start_codon:yes stop_codon:yes gene_type:complete